MNSISARKIAPPWVYCNCNAFLQSNARGILWLRIKTRARASPQPLGLKPQDVPDWLKARITLLRMLPGHDETQSVEGVGTRSLFGNFYVCVTTDEIAALRALATKAGV